MEGINDLEKFHTESIDRILKETSDQLGKMKPIISQSTFDKFPKVRAAQIGGPDIDMEYVVDKDGNMKYLEPRRRR